MNFRHPITSPRQNLEFVDRGSKEIDIESTNQQLTLIAQSSQNIFCEL